MMPQSHNYQTFCADPNTMAALQAEAESRLYAIAVNVDYSNPVNFDGSTTTKHRMDKQGKSYYRASSGYNANGVPFVNLHYINFKGDIRWRFDSSEVLKSLYEQHKAGQTYKARPRPQAKVYTPDEDSTTPEQYLAQAHKAFDQLSTLPPYNANTYLQNKVVDPFAAPNIRYGVSFARYEFGEDILMLRCQNIKGHTTGYQTIYGDGTKRFTTGFKKQGSFIVLGNLSSKPKRIFVCEGWATGVSIQLANPDSLVICALDAGNLQPVTKAIREQYGTRSKCNITIWADDDAHLEAEGKRNSGMVAAHQAAHRYKCDVVSPTFPQSAKGKHLTDANDLHQLMGIDEVRTQSGQATKPNPKYIFFGFEKQQATFDQRLFPNSKLVEVGSRYLDPTTLVAEIIKDTYGTIAVKSGLGTGKTQLCQALIKTMPNHTVLYLSHLVSLIYNASNRLGLDLYQDYKNSSEDLDSALLLGMCLNSTPMLIKEDQRIRTFDIVIVDEIEQFIRRLPTDIKDKTVVLRCLEHIIKRAKKLVVLDAHISPLTRMLLKLWRPDEQCLYILNHYQAGQGRKVIFYETEGVLELEATKALEAGEQIYIATNSKLKAEKIDQLLRQTGKQGLLVSSDNSDDIAVKQLFGDINKEITQYDYIIATPSISTGVSIDVQHFTKVFGFFEHCVNLPTDAMQAINRVRNSTELHLWVSDKTNNLPTDPKVIASEWSTTANHDLALMGFDDDGSLFINDENYEKIALTVTQQSNYYQNDFSSHLLKLLFIDGYTISHHQADVEMLEAGKFISTTGKEMAYEEYVKALVNAPNISAEEAAELDSKWRHTKQETITLDKHKVQDFYGLDHPDEQTLQQTIKRDDRGRFRQKVKRVETTLATRSELIQMYHDQKDRNIKLKVDVKKYAVLQELYQQLYPAIGIDEHFNLNNATYSKFSPHILTFIAWVMANRQDLGIINIPSDKQLTDDPLRFIKNLLNRIGLSQELVTKMRTGDDGRERIYRVSRSKWTEMQQILINRGVASKVGVSPDGTLNSFNIYNNTECPSVPTVTLFHNKTNRENNAHSTN